MDAVKKPDAMSVAPGEMINWLSADNEPAPLTKQGLPRAHVRILRPSRKLLALSYGFLSPWRRPRR
jgi:hypothetical protein